MQKCRLWGCCVLVTVAMFMASAAGAADTVMLQREGWDPTVRQSLNEMFVLYGKGSPNYNPSIRPYAVFDFDNTVSILDVEEQLAIYQLEHMRKTEETTVNPGLVFTNSKAGRMVWAVVLTEPETMSSSLSVMLASAKARFSFWVGIWVSRGFITRALTLAGHTSAQEPQPRQSSVYT